MNIKRGLNICCLGACVAVQSAFAAPLDKSQVAKDAKWLAHIDIERLMQAPFAEMAVERLKEEIARNNESMISIDIDLVLAQLKSLTAYGSEIHADSAAESVMVLEAGDKLQAIIDGFLAHQELMAEESDVSFQRLEDKPFDTYLFDEELYVSHPEVGLVIASKNFERIESAFAVIKGKAESLAEAPGNLVLNESDDFFLLATATGLDKLKDVPPQARILQKTKGGQISLGQSGDDFRANLVLATSSREVSQQLYRIVQGMVALASFTQVENQNVMDIVNRLDVSLGDDRVSVDISYPIENLMKLISEAMEGRQHHHEEHSGDNAGEQSGTTFQSDSCDEKRASDFAGKNRQSMIVAGHNDE